MDVSPFRIERYYARYEFTTRYTLSSSDCESRTIAELLELEPDAHARLLNTWCGYTESPGSLELRQAIAALYERIDPDEVIVTSCAEEGIFLLYHALLGLGDHAIVEAPCYESALELARRTGAEVTPWRRRFQDGWSHDLVALEALIRPETKAVYVNQPHNPTGTLMDRATFARVAELARANALTLFSDEVYRELEHDPAIRLPAACDVDARAVSLGSISKSYGLPGLRLGWLVTRDAALREAIMRWKDYTTICSSATSGSSRATCPGSTRSSRATRTSSSGSARPQARSASRASGKSATSIASASDSRAWACSCSRDPCTTSPATSGSASAAPISRKRWMCSSRAWRRRRRFDSVRGRRRGLEACERHELALAQGVDSRRAAEASRTR